MRDMASTQVVSYLSTQASYVIYNTAKKILLGALLGSLIKVFHVSMQVLFDSGLSSLEAGISPYSSWGRRHERLMTFSGGSQECKQQALPPVKTIQTPSYSCFHQRAPASFSINTYRKWSKINGPKVFFFLSSDYVVKSCVFTTFHLYLSLINIQGAIYFVSTIDGWQT